MTWLTELQLTEEQVERRQRLTHELTGALTTMTMTSMRTRTVTDGPRAPWWWQGDDEASDASLTAIEELRSGG